MNRLLASALAASVTIALPATAFAETLDYDFAMKVTSVSGDTWVFDGLDVGDTINVSVLLETGTGDGDAQITVSEVAVTGTNIWGSGSWSTAWGEGAIAGTQLDSQNLLVNGTLITNGAAYTQTLGLSFSGVSGGETSINTGWLELGVGNHVNAKLRAEYVDSPTSVPELDPKSGTGAIALLVGGMALAFSRRRRQQCDGVAG